MVDNGIHVCGTTTGMGDNAFSVLSNLKNTVENENEKKLY